MVFSEVWWRHRTAVEESVAEDGTATRVTESGDRRIGVLGCVDAVREVKQRRDTGVEGFERTETATEVDILRGVGRADTQPDAIEVVSQCPVATDRAHLRLPGVPVGVDHPGHDDVARDVDNVGVTNWQVDADGNNRVALDQNISRRRSVGIQRQNLATAQQGPTCAPSCPRYRGCYPPHRRRMRRRYRRAPVVAAHLGKIGDSVRVAIAKA